MDFTAKQVTAAGGCRPTGRRHNEKRDKPVSARSGIEELINQTPFVDTHEHIIEESVRLGEPADGLYSCNDWAYLLWGYTRDDLASAGMPEQVWHRLLNVGADIDEKWRLLEPYWRYVRHTGYGQATRLTIQSLYSEEDITQDSYHRIHEKYLELVRPGYYEHVLRGVAGVKSCQVNSLVDVFCKTEYPDLLMQDLSIVPMHSQPEIENLCSESGRPGDTLEQWHSVIDWFFETYGLDAVAVKSQAAYRRRLDYADIPPEQAAPLWERYARGECLPADQMKALEDHLFRYCINKATEYKLPVKLHTGYYAGYGNMPLERLSDNPSDMCLLAAQFPDTRFIVMHIGYPYQEAMLALAKHYPNVTIDMCWAWIINPAASVRFVKDFLKGVPSNKLLSFGGDYVLAEQVVGHAVIARRGLCQALAELIEDGWISEEDVRELVPQLMYGNAESLFPRLQAALA